MQKLPFYYEYSKNTRSSFKLKKYFWLLLIAAAVFFIAKQVLAVDDPTPPNFGAPEITAAIGSSTETIVGNSTANTNAIVSGNASNTNAIVKSIEDNLHRLLKFMAGIREKEIAKESKQIFAPTPELDLILKRATQLKDLDSNLNKVQKSGVSGDVNSGSNQISMKSELRRSLFSENNPVDLLTKYLSYCSRSDNTKETCKGSDCTVRELYCYEDKDLYGNLNFGNFLNTTQLESPDPAAESKLLGRQDFLELYFTNFKNKIEEKDALSTADIADRNKADLGKVSRALEYLQKEALLAPAKYSLLNMYNARQLKTKESTDSLIGLMEKEANRRYTDSNWYKAMSTLTAEPLLREMASMEAYRLWMEHKRYLQMERVEALLASILIQTEKNLPATGANANSNSVGSSLKEILGGEQNGG
ncbi:MAG: hypothetical protein ACKOAD_06955 [Gammaproteobacteria bacterium]